MLSPPDRSRQAPAALSHALSGDWASAAPEAMKPAQTSAQPAPNPPALAAQPCQPAEAMLCPSTPPAMHASQQPPWHGSEDDDIFGTQLSPLLHLPPCPDHIPMQLQTVTLASEPSVPQQAGSDHEQEEMDGASALGSDSEDGQCLNEDAGTGEDRASSEEVAASSEEVARLSWALLDRGGYLQMTIQEAAARLQVGLTSLKKLCRRNGIARWPHRTRARWNNTLCKTDHFFRSSDRMQGLLVPCAPALPKGTRGKKPKLRPAKANAALAGEDSGTMAALPQQRRPALQSADLMPALHIHADAAPDLDSPPVITTNAAPESPAGLEPERTCV
ncbi:hypothetical protein WJX73_001445 [Symbiochloris irregularis]|uniref:RWP-RK domain-containing protein n=1 Tax=Symbiochloris irregularis TaxID=706552 RepID=A0AAW1PL66_9CHLO